MRLSYILGFLALFITINAQETVGPIRPIPHDPSIVPNSYIILLHEGYDIDEFIKEISSVGDVRVTHRYPILHGLAIYSKYHNLRTLNAYPAVRIAENDRIYTIDPPYPPISVPMEQSSADMLGSAF